MARMKIENLDFEESYDIQKGAKSNVEIANARQSSIAEDDFRFLENMKNATKQGANAKERAKEYTKHRCWHKMPILWCFTLLLDSKVWCVW